MAGFADFIKHRKYFVCVDTNPISKDDLLRHDKWLCMMYPRIKLLHELLSESGTFWMTIDDNEVHHARALLDEIFGQDRFFACVVWQKRTSRSKGASRCRA